MWYPFRLKKLSNATATAGRANWQPWTVRTPFLVSFIALCIIFAISIEVLIRASRSSGGLTFGTSGHSNVRLSAAASFVFNYLPTVIAVAFGLLWATAAHDFFRLEPFFQLSKPGGVHAKDSLLLEYSYTFPLFVPWMAFKRRHYTVLCSSVMVLFIALALTPFMSGLFDEATTLISRPSQASLATLHPAENQTISSRFAYQAYNHIWLNGSLPSFTTPEYAIAAFQPSPGTSSTTNTSETWTGETTLYEADLQCSPAVFTPLEFPGVGVFAVNITDGKDITITYSDGGVIEDLPSEVENEYNFVNPFQDYLGAFKTPWTSNLIELHLEREVFLYIWATTSDSAAAEISGANSTGLSTLPREWTGVFCEPRYWSQAVKATVEMEAGVIKDIERLGEREAYDAPHKSGFARFVHQGQIPEGEFSGPAGPEGFGDLTRQFPTVDPQLVKRFGKSLEVDDGFADEGTSLVFVSDAASIPAFSLYGRTNGSLAGLLDPLELAKMYSDAFKLLFAFSVTLELTNHNASTPVSVSREFRTWAFAINGVWSRATQAGLGFLGVLALCLVVLGWSRRSNLDGEPNNLAAAMGMLARSQALTRDLYNSEYHDPAALKKILRKSKRRYRLQLVPGQGPQVDVIEEWVDIKADHNRLLPPAPTPAGDADPYKSAPSWPLSWWSGVVFFSFFAVLLVGLVFVFIYDRRNNGLPTLLSTGSFGYKLLYSYLPTILGTAVEPLLVTLGSYYCMVGPYKILHRRRAGAPTSLALLMDYDKSPPHFQLLRSLKARDVELGALTIALILANVLAVSFAGLFSLTFEEMVVQTEVARYSVPSVVAEFQQPAADVYYALDGAFTGAVPPPNWTTTEYYVLPFNSIEYDTTQQLESTTVGFGADITCELVPKSEIIVPCDPYSRKNGGCIAIKPFLDVELSDVWNASGVMPGYECWGSPVQKPFQWQSGPNANFIEQSCAEYFFIGWVEFPVDTNSTSPEWPYGFLTEEPDTVMLNCSSTVKVAGMTAMVDEARNVVSMDNIQPMDQQAVENLMGVNGTAGLIRSFVKSLEIASTSFDSSHMIPWFGSLMSTIDPSLIRQNQRNVTILPNTTNIVGAFEDVYKRVFAASLRQYADDIFDTRKPRDSIPGTATVVQARVRVSVPMFGIATGILIYFLVLILYLYLGPPAGDHGISHLPTTLATAYTLLYASNAREELSGIHGEGQEERAKKLKEMRNSYGFGGFVGLDKRQHFGVYRKSD